MEKVVKLARQLIQFDTVTPKDNGILEFIAKRLEESGFASDIQFFGEAEERTGNIYSKFGVNGRNFCFAGHVDVVPVGNEMKWRFPPFSGDIEDGILYGRGAVDMKGAVACFIEAADEFIKKYPDFNETISIMLTGDEEDTGKFGIKEMLKYLDKKNEKYSACLIGEPTCEHKMCDSIKLGRRGSVNFEIEFIGVQGHVAYQDLIKNPITVMAGAIVLLKNHKFDRGDEYFEATNLEFVNVETDNFQRATNVVPSMAKTMMNIRYNHFQTGEKLVKFVADILTENFGKDAFKLTYKISDDAFFFGETDLSRIAVESMMEVSKNDKIIANCKGGITDGRHIIKYCKNAVEVGLCEEKMHKIDECVAIEDLIALKQVYTKILEKYFYNI